MRRKSNPHQLFSMEDASRRLEVTRARLRQLIADGVLESYQLSGWDKVFVLRDEVDGYMAWKEKENV
jgi:excisionase family DNA binding protein